MDNPAEKVFVLRGGQGASKTITVLELIIQSLMTSEKEATVLSSELSKMKRTVIRDYKKICKDWGIIQRSEDFNKSESKHEYPNESYLDFLGADVTDVGKGFRRDILYINEADKLNIDTAIEFISRCDLVIIDYNPNKLFWGDEFINDHNFITLTFEDNEFLSESEVKSILEYKQKGFYNPDLPFDLLFKEANIKSKYWANRWKVYGLGMVGSLDGVVFENWKIVDEIPATAKLISYGLDFGFTNDPSAGGAMYQEGDNLYFDEMFYETGMLNSDIINRWNSLGVSKSANMVGDSAEPKSIEEIRRAGFRIQPAKKGADSIKASIDLLQKYNIFITRRSNNLKNELERYIWKVDTSGKSLNEPVDRDNHAIDGIMRYPALNHLGAKRTVTFY